MAKKLSDNQITSYTNIYKERGENGLYKFVVGNSIVRFASGVKTPETDLLDLSDSFFSLFRSSGEDIYFDIGKVMRRGAHTIYRKLLKTQNKQVNNKFLNIIKWQ